MLTPLSERGEWWLGKLQIRLASHVLIERDNVFLTLKIHVFKCRCVVNTLIFKDKILC